MQFSTIIAIALSTLSYHVAAHGYLSSPPPRGIQKAGYQIDDLKSPNNKGLCRGEPEGQITKVTPGQVLRLGLTITAPHVGPCRVTLLDTNLSNESKPFADKQNCAAPGGPGFWDIKLPSNVRGRKVLRWYWEGQHISTPGEPYEQCIDLDFGGGNGGDNYTPPQRPSKPKKSKKKPAKAYKPKPKPVPSYDDQEEGDNSYGDEAPSSYSAPSPSYNAPTPSPSYNGGSCQHGAYRCVSRTKYAVCNWGAWIDMPCAAGTVCKPNGNSIVCGWA
jgi:hypothetical protein